MKKITITRRMFVTGITVVALAFVGGCQNDQDNLENEEPSNEPIEEEPKADPIEMFVLLYNSQVDDKLTRFEEFDPCDKNSYHYRTEFRLNAFKGSKGMACYTEGAWERLYGSGDQSLSGISTDLILSNKTFGDNFLRVYASGDADALLDFWKRACLILDPDIDVTDLDAVLQSYYENGTLFISSSVSLPSSKDLTSYIQKLGTSGSLTAYIESAKDFVKAVEAGEIVAL